MEIKSIKWSRTNEYTLRGLKLLGQTNIKEAIVSLLQNLKCSSNCCQTVEVREEIYSKYPMQSDIQQQTNDNDSTKVATTVKFNDENTGETQTIPYDIQLEDVSVPASVSIAKFLNRPVLIKNYNWTVGSQTVDSFDPWNLYFSHTSIKKKLDNYFLLRCNLKIKVVINASPFHYGALLMAYKPMYNTSLPANIDTSVTGTSADLQNVAFSQLPRIYVYPQTSQGGELMLPFLWPREWLDITSATNTTRMGTVFIRPMTTLRFANTGTGPNCNVQVFAWAENVELSGPTVKLSMQSKRDEYGVISGPASAVAHAMGALSKAPVIGPYATTTRLGAQAVSEVAKAFGYTNVPVIDDVHSFTPQPFPHFASPEIGTAIEKLTIDPKNELTIDPKALGLDSGDELLIENIVKRESYLALFNWTIANVPDDILFSMRVTPYLERADAGTNQTIVQMTPMSMIARLFAYWKGDIKLRLKFVCSQYHKGRLRVSWDPVGAIGSTADSTTEVFTQIVDLAECTDITFNIPYMQDLAFLQKYPSFAARYAVDGSMTNDPGYTNGVITVRVLNELTAPLNTADISILAFVSGGDNLSFAVPVDPDTNDGSSFLQTPLCAFPVQSKFEHYDVEKTDVEMGDAPSVIQPTTYLLYHGEKISSLRQLLRRTSYNTFVGSPSSLITDTNSQVFVTNKLPRYPLSPGYDPNGIHTANKVVDRKSVV